MPVLMDRAYDDNATHQLVLDLGLRPEVPPKTTRFERLDIVFLAFV